MIIFEIDKKKVDNVASMIAMSIITKGGKEKISEPIFQPLKKLEKILTGKEYHISKYDDKVYILSGAQTNLAYFVFLTTNPDELKNFNLDNPKLISEIKSKYPVKTFDVSEFYNAYSSMEQKDKKEISKRTMNINVIVAIIAIVILISVIITLVFVRNK